MYPSSIASPEVGWLELARRSISSGVFSFPKNLEPTNEVLNKPILPASPGAVQHLGPRALLIGPTVTFGAHQ